MGYYLTVSAQFAIANFQFLNYNLRMNKYELTLVLDGKAGAAKKKKVMETLEKTLKIFKGAITESKEWGVKEMAYKMGKSDSGLYLYYEIELDPSGTRALNDKLRTDPDLIRYLLIKKE
jgi:small subunit ribosomal protein S6